MNPNNQRAPERSSAPPPIRLLNAVAAKAMCAAGKDVSLSLNDLLETAQGRTHLDDPGGRSALKAFGAQLESVNREGDLTPFGLFAWRQFLIAKLCNRLRIVEAVKQFPCIAKQTISRPIVITGWYRCGTTYLHNLLATHPHLRAPLYWELMHPCPAVDPRKVNPKKLIRRTKLANRIHHYLAPDFKYAHSMPAEAPEECLHLFDNAGMGTTAFFITEAKSFAGWLLEHDLRPGYEFYVLQLQLLNWLRPGSRWILKWPYHLWHLDALLGVLTDVMVVHIHRDPRQAILSVCNLAALAREPFCNQIDRQALGQFWINYNAIGLERGLAARERAGTNRILDVDYAELTSNPLAVIQKVLDRAGLEPDAAWLRSIPTACTENQATPAAYPAFSLSQFGLDADQIRERFATYIDTYDWG
ncbi:MAG: sulfotransferase [Desulfobacterales bacterium]